MSPVKILIADDHTMIAQMWGLFLSNEKEFQVLERVDNRKDLMNAVTLLQPDIVLLDIVLSDGSSLDILSTLKQKSPHTKYLAVSAYADISTVRMSFAAGVHGYLTKTSALPEMHEAIASVMKGEVYYCKEINEMMLADLANELDKEKGKAGSDLTKKEKQVAYLVYKGLSAKDIAEKLGVSFKTVEVHRHHIYQKLGIQKAAKLLWYVKENLHLFSDVNV